MDNIIITRPKQPKRDPSKRHKINLFDIEFEEVVIDPDRAMKSYEVSPIIKQFGIWVVTSYGLECLWHYYPIEGCRLVNDTEPWVSHMADKTWVYETWECLRNFEEALMFAREYFTKIAGANK